MYYSLLLTIAPVAAALFHLLVAAFSSLFLSLFVASLLAGFPANEQEVWRLGNGLACHRPSGWREQRRPGHNSGGVSCCELGRICPRDPLGTRGDRAGH